MVSLVPAQERLRGWLCGSFPFGHRLYAGSRVKLTEGRRMHSSSRGDVFVASGSHSAGDGAAARGMVA
jgi:hypothetical protein